MAVRKSKKPAKSARTASKKASKKSAKKSVKKAVAKPAAKTGKSRAPAGKAAQRESNEPVLLSGGNPQIPKGYGEGPVQAYIAAMPGWKKDLGRWLDSVVERTVPGVQKAVKWNSPFYGTERDLWFLSFHCFNKYVKVTFFRGTSLNPVPSGESKHPEVRYYDIYENDPRDEAKFAAWVKQASQLPGERL